MAFHLIKRRNTFSQRKVARSSQIDLKVFFIYKFSLVQELKERKASFHVDLQSFPICHRKSKLFACNFGVLNALLNTCSNIKSSAYNMQLLHLYTFQFII